MNDFDRAIMHLDKAFGFIAAPHQYVSKKDEGDKLVVVERGDLVFVFNFHPSNSYTDYRVGCFHPGPYKIVLSSDEEQFGGYQNVTKAGDVEFFAGLGGHDERPHSFQARPCTSLQHHGRLQALDAIHCSNAGCTRVARQIAPLCVRGATAGAGLLAVPHGDRLCAQ